MMTFRAKTNPGTLGVIAGAWCLGCLFAAPPGFADDEALVAPPPAQNAPRHSASRLEERVALLTAELGLDTQQQAAMRQILAVQREQVLKVWNDTSIPAAHRVNATKSISERTADAIRALLTEEQRTKYFAAHKPRDPASTFSSPSVEDWMGATRAP